VSTKRVAKAEPLFPELANPRQRAFLTAYRETGNVRLACTVSHVGRSSHYRWLDEDPAYRGALELAREDAADVLEAEAQRRAVEGVEKPTGWYQGKAGGYVREYSDLLLIFLLKGARPEKYKDRLELKGGLASIDYSRLSDEQLQRISNGEHPMAVLGSVPVPQARALPAPGDGTTRTAL
jgi:hypothetical protein